MKNVKWVYVIIILLNLVTFVLMPGCSSETEPANESVSIEEAAGTEEADSANAEEILEEEGDEPEQGEEESSGSFEWATFTCEEHGFSIDYPDTWVVLEPSGAFPVTFRPSEGTQTTIQVEYYKSNFVDYTYDDYVNNLIEKVRRIRSDAEFGESRSVEINEHPFVLLEFNWTIEALDDLVMHAREYYTAKNYGFIVRHVIQEDELDEILPIAEQMIESFQFIN